MMRFDTLYEGQFDKHNSLHGYGRMIEKNGAYYIGELSSGSKQGEGKYVQNGKK